MYYIEDQDPILVKQEVLTDREGLRKLQQEVILKFGQYVHRSYRGAVGPYGGFARVDQEYPYLKNYTETGADESGLKQYEYDEFVTPELTGLIEGLLDGDAAAIDGLKRGPAGCLPSAGEEERQRQLHKELQELLDNPPDRMDVERFRRLTEEIRSFYRREQDGEQLRELQEYYRRALDCVKFKPVMTLYKDKLNEFRRIYNDIEVFYRGTGGAEAVLRMTRSE